VIGFAEGAPPYINAWVLMSVLGVTQISERCQPLRIALYRPLEQDFARWANSSG
jgi:hypothetical protein